MAGDDIQVEQLHALPTTAFYTGGKEVDFEHMHMDFRSVPILPVPVHVRRFAGRDSALMKLKSILHSQHYSQLTCPIWIPCAS